jgi:two-component system nitrate/nitrite response regulator NarL
MRAGIKEVLSTDRLYKLTAIAETGAECLELLQRLRPDVAIIDINISHPSAARILREVKINQWQTRICFLTEGQIPPNLVEDGIDKKVVFANGRFPDDLRARLREIATDLHKQVKSVTGSYAIPHTTPAPASLSQRLTFRQKQIVAMLKNGSSNKEIAQLLGVSEGTIKVHLHRVYQRIGVSNRTQLAAKSFAAD